MIDFNTKPFIDGKIIPQQKKFSNILNSIGIDSKISEDNVVFCTFTDIEKLDDYISFQNSFITRENEIGTILRFKENYTNIFKFIIEEESNAPIFDFYISHKFENQSLTEYFINIIKYDNNLDEINEFIQKYDFSINLIVHTYGYKNANNELIFKEVYNSDETWCEIEGILLAREFSDVKLVKKKIIYKSETVNDFERLISQTLRDYLWQKDIQLNLKEGRASTISFDFEEKKQFNDKISFLKSSSLIEIKYAEFEENDNFKFKVRLQVNIPDLIDISEILKEKHSNIEFNLSESGNLLNYRYFYSISDNSQIIQFQNDVFNLANKFSFKHTILTPYNENFFFQLNISESIYDNILEERINTLNRIDFYQKNNRDKINKNIPSILHLTSNEGWREINFTQFIGYCFNFGQLNSKRSSGLAPY